MCIGTAMESADLHAAKVPGRRSPSVCQAKAQETMAVRYPATTVPTMAPASGSTARRAPAGPSIARNAEMTASDAASPTRPAPESWEDTSEQ
jgi:hypothetical protein